MIKAYLVCDRCGKSFEGPEVRWSQYYTKELRRDARKHGWKQRKNQKGGFFDYCLDCSKEVSSPKRLRLLRMVWSKPTVKAAEILGISDVALAKQCKRLNVPKPPIGFWNKWHAGHQYECRSLIPTEVREELGEEFLREVFPLDPFKQEYEIDNSENLSR